MAGVYVHVPFCASRCDYCAFATWTDRHHLTDAYVSAVVADARRQLPGWPAPETVFFGGGTPSLLDPSQVAAVLDAIGPPAGTEVTLECNPESVDDAKLAGYRRAGVSRLSFGVQSMDPAVLAGLGRAHRPGAVVAAVDAAVLAGFGDAYSVDLIIGGAGQTPHSWERTLASILSLEVPPSHVSAYGLTVEAGTPLAADRSRHPDPDFQADAYEAADAILAEAGLRWYEISNWARPGMECRHNLLYWRQGDYLGLGCAAHSHRADPLTGWSRRWWNVRTPERYIRLVTSGGSPEAAGEDLDPPTRTVEALQLALRTRDGVPSTALPAWHEGDLALAGLVEPGGDGRLRLTLRGRLLANEVSVRLQAPL